MLVEKFRAYTQVTKQRNEVKVGNTEVCCTTPCHATMSCVPFVSISPINRRRRPPFSFCPACRSFPACVRVQCAVKQKFLNGSRPPLFTVA